jgi:hypothetical protein
MAMTIFLTLNALGVIFLLYVLAHFWLEGRRPKTRALRYAEEMGRRDWAEVAVVTHPISHSAQGGLSVIPFRPMDQYGEKSALEITLVQGSQAPIKRFSTR